MGLDNSNAPGRPGAGQGSGQGYGSGYKGKPKRPMIPDDFIMRVNTDTNIVELISARVEIKRKGANYMGLCPFHSEKSPSFSVSPNKGFYKCFGCGAAGGPVDFLMEHDALSFREAVKQLAVDLGMPLPEALQDTPSDGTGGNSHFQVETTKIYDALDLSRRFYFQAMIQTPEAIAYIKERGFTKETLKKFGIGFAPNDWRPLEIAFPDYQDNPFLVQAGLVKEKETHGRMNRYDAFRNRLMFPIKDVRGRVIAFSGRAMPGDPNAGAKYINSPETPVFVKSATLYGLFEAREEIRKKKSAIVVEGQADVVSLHQAGICNAVAGMGTAFTHLHFQRLSAMTDTMYFTYDGDSAGQEAAWKVVNTCIAHVEDRHALHFLTMPDGVDPDDFVRTQGSQAFLDLLAKSPSLSEFIITRLKAKHNNLASSEDRARFAAEGSNIAGRLPYQGKLRALVLDLIATEAAIPGSGIKAIQNAARKRRQHSVWSTLEDAVKAAPHQALIAKDQLLALLDEESEDEQDLINALNALDAHQLATEQPTAERMASSEWLQARDVLASAIDLLVHQRQNEAMQELRARHTNGEVSDVEFARESMSIHA